MKENIKLDEYNKIIYDIEMEIYYKYNEKIANMYDNLGKGVTYQDLKYAEEEETMECIKLLKENLKRVIEEKDKRISELEKQVELMAEWLYGDDTSFGYGELKEINTPERINQYFKKLAKENEDEEI